MTIDQYMTLKEAVIAAGYADEIDWQQSVMPVSSPEAFWTEHAWVVLNSGMKNQVARKIWGNIKEAYSRGMKPHDVFRHKGKCDAINYVRSRAERLLKEYQAAVDKLDYLRSLPWIGEVTCYHLAKNFGLDVCKPDRHLVRIARNHQTTPQEMCGRLASETGDRIATVDLVIWRAANLGMV